jgi:hypothetical protein
VLRLKQDGHALLHLVGPQGELCMVCPHIPAGLLGS